MKITNELNKRYGRLTVIEFDETRNYRARWKCLCDCGNITVVNGSMLRNHKIRSCGCLKDELTSKRFTKHGLTHTLLYDVWIKIKSRCCNIRDKDFHNYGGRNITIFNDWQHDFLSFYNWSITNGYKEGLTIERINVNGNYEPDNCTWIINAEQALNKRNTHNYTYKGETKGIRYFSEKYNVNYYALKARLLNYKWNIKDAIETKIVKGRNQYGIKTVSKRSD